MKKHVRPDDIFDAITDFYLDLEDTDAYPFTKEDEEFIYSFAVVLAARVSGCLRRRRRVSHHQLSTN